MSESAQRLTQALEQALKRHAGDADLWWVALSGGIDSLSLLHCLYTLARSAGEAGRVRALHVNHGLSDQAPEWAATCQRYCDQLGVPLRLVEVAVEPRGAGLEAAARDARYRAFTEVLGPRDLLLLGHHQDDQVETFFLRLLRGAGAAGLSGMPESRQLDDARLIRPWLDEPRSGISEYARALGLVPVADPSNEDTSLDRNYLRHEVLPLIEQRWPGYRDVVTRTAQLLREELAGLEAGHLPATEYSAMGEPCIPVSALGERPATSLRAWLRALGCSAPSSAALAEFLQQLAVAGDSAAPVLALGPWQLRTYRGRIHRVPAAAMPPPTRALRLRPGHTAGVGPLGQLSLRPDSDGFVLDPDGAVTICWRGCLAGPAPHLKQRFQDLGIPPWWRDRIPLVWGEAGLLAIAAWRVRAAAESERGERWCLHWQRPTD